MTATHGVGVYGNAVGVTTPLEMKMAQLAYFQKNAANTIRPGLFWDGNQTVVSGKANMSYDVRAFTAVLSRGATAGAVVLANDAVYNVATTAAPGSNSRYDVVYIWQREYSIDGTNSDPVIGVLQGTAAASPTVPALTSFPGAIALATILVPAGVTATNSGTTITQVAPFTALDGNPIPVRNATEQAAITSPAQGDLSMRLDLGKRIDQYYELYNSSTNPYGAKTSAGWYPTGSKLIYSKLAATATTAITPVNTEVAVAWSSIESANYANSWAVGNASRLVLPILGYWEIEVQLTATNTSDKTLVGRLKKNGVNTTGQMAAVGISGFTDANVKFKWIVEVTNIADYVELFAIVNSVTSAPALAGASSYMMAKYLGPLSA